MKRTPHRTVSWSVLLLAAAVTVASAGSVERLKAFRKQGWLQLDLEAKNLLDAKTASTVESGLPGTCVYRIVLEDHDGDPIGQRSLKLSLRLDLWENHYVLQGPGGSTRFATLTAADSAWSDIRGVRLLPLDRLLPGEEYRLQVEVAVQPLAAEDRARISRYVRQNSGGDRKEFALDVGALFDRFLGDGGRHRGQASFEGPVFRLEELEEIQ
ncbi:MAG: DUF4390 domain-containing protein [Candidatus Krumholzibacteriia bacterium]